MLARRLRISLKLRSAQAVRLLSSPKKESKALKPNLNDENEFADRFGAQQNHIWTMEEINKNLSGIYRHKPKTVSDRFANSLMYGFYYSFNYMTGFKQENTTIQSVKWRLIVLESFAGVPGFVAAAFRYFRSLRMLRHDFGWIDTLLEEAENERMHLLVCLQMFKASMLVRWVVLGAQLFMTPVPRFIYFQLFAMNTYFLSQMFIVIHAINPSLHHRFVGYLEETAVHTYANIIRQGETPGTEINKEWSKLPAPELAIRYWHLPPNSTFLDTLRCMFADEAHHRDVNHALAEKKLDDPCEFALQHRIDAIKVWKLQQEGKYAWPPKPNDSSSASTQQHDDREAAGQPEGRNDNAEKKKTQKSKL